jgi:hypothetical protein
MTDGLDHSPRDLRPRRVHRRAVNGADVLAVEERRLIDVVDKMSQSNRDLHAAYDALAREHAMGWINFAALGPLRQWLICKIAGRRVVGLEVASDADEDRDALPPRAQVGAGAGGPSGPP